MSKQSKIISKTFVYTTVQLCVNFRIITALNTICAAQAESSQQIKDGVNIGMY